MVKRPRAARPARHARTTRASSPGDQEAAAIDALFDAFARNLARKLVVRSQKPVPVAGRAKAPGVPQPPKCGDKP